MSKKMNTKAVDNRFEQDVRLAGGMGNVAAKQSNILTLRRLVLACLLWENNAYVDGLEVASQIKVLIPLCEPEEVAKLAIECRVMQKLRHVPILMIVEMAKHESHRTLIADVIPKVCTRADMLSDLVSLYWNGGKRPLPSAMKRGIAKAFLNFNEYSLAKYRGTGNAVKLRDVMFMVHPKTVTQEQADCFKKLAENTLQTPDTWEVALSSGADKKESWTRLIQENKLGGLALLRNIRNMKAAGVDRLVIQNAIANVKTGMLLPLDYFKAVRYSPEFERDIEEVMFRSYANVSKLTGKSLIILDVSGSMRSEISSKDSEFTRLDAGTAMAIAAINMCEDFEFVITAGVDSTYTGKHNHIKYPNKGFGLVKQIEDERVKVGGGGIFTRQCLDWCQLNVGTDFDRIIIFSDSQDCDRVKAPPKPFGKFNYIIDVSSHSHGVNYKGVWTSEISGWSSSFLTYIASMEGLDNHQSEDS